MGKAKDQDFAVTSATLRSLENALERLKCLNYELHFVHDQQQKRVKPNDFILQAPNQGSQFNHYIELIKWLIATIRHQDDTTTPFDVEEYEDPNVIAQKLMLSLRSLNFELEFPITKLKQPYGEIACSILDFLTSKAMSNFVFKEPSYVNESQSDEEDGDIVDDTSLGDLFTSDVTTADAIDIRHYNDDSPRTKVDADNTNIQSNIDPIAWKRELENVGPLLLEISFDTRSQVDSVFAESQKFQDECEASKTAFARLCKESAGMLDHIESKERAINDKFRNVGNEHEETSCKIKELEGNRRQSSAALDDARNELLAMTNQLCEAKVRVDEKGNSITDTSQLVRIKTTLQDIKAEIRDYDLQIGILEHTLLHKRLQVRA